MQILPITRSAFVAKNRTAGASFKPGSPATNLLVRGLEPLEDARGVRVHVVHGSVWLTQAGCIDDVILRVGESYQICRNGLTLVSACAGSRCAGPPASTWPGWRRFPK